MVPLQKFESVDMQDIFGLFHTPRCLTFQPREMDKINKINVDYTSGLFHCLRLMMIRSFCALFVCILED